MYTYKYIRKRVKDCLNENVFKRILLCLFHKKTSIALIYLKPSLVASVSDRYVPVVGSRDRNVCVTYEPEDESYALRPNRMGTPSDIGNRVGRKERERKRYLKKNRNARTSLRQKYWMTRHALFRAHRSPVLVLFSSFVSLSSSSSIHPFACHVFYEMPGFLWPFCSRPRRTARRERDCITRSRKSFAKLSRMKASEKLCCLWRIDKRRDEKKICEVSRLN